MASGTIRGIFPLEESDPDFKDVVTFETAAECTSWTKAHTACTNPAYPHCHHIYTTLCDWDQVQSLLLDKLAEYRRRYPCRRPGQLPASNVFSSEPGILKELTDRLNLPIHSLVDEDSTLNTLRYLFFHMRCGIFVLIRGGKLAMFVPFVNKDYVNTWGDAIDIEQPLPEYVKDKHQFTDEQYIMDKSRWWANGNIICNVDSPAFWGDSYLPQLRHMLQTLCERREVPDCEFFVNKRDFPHLKRNASEPYDFIFDEDDLPLSRESYSTYAPIASFFVGKDFADLPLVTTDDWETATGRVFPPNAVDIRSEKNRKSNDVPWAERKATAFFRGNSTGPGTDVETNQRIKLAALNQAWKSQPQYADGNPLDGVRYLDAGIVNYNMRDRKMQGRPMTFIKPEFLRIDKVDRVPMYAQARYKYHLYVDGHCAAMRYASMMPLGVVILKVASVTKADSMWFFQLLRPYDIRAEHPDPAGDHIPVAADLSDLADVIAWCKAHDDVCQRIVANCRSLYDRVVSIEGQLDYMQLMTHEIAKRFVPQAQRAEASAGAVAAAGAQLLVPAFAAPPSAGDADWFGPSNREYAITGIGPTRLGPPAPRQGMHGLSATSNAYNFEADDGGVGLETADCPCPQCEVLRADAAKRERDAAALRELAAANSGKAADGAAASVVSAGTSGEAQPAAAAPPAVAAAIAAASKLPTPSAPAIAVNDKVKAALAQRIALAKAKEAERAAAASGAPTKAAPPPPQAPAPVLAPAPPAAADSTTAVAGTKVTLKLKSSSAAASAAGTAKRPREEG